ncbi:hypothetical protein ANTPLA_LOCUS3708 [Anthophora plagiata]
MCLQSGQRSKSYRDEEATDQQTTWQHRCALLFFFPPSCCLMSLTSSPTIIIDCNEAKAHLHFFAYSTLQHSCFVVSTTDGATPRLNKKICRASRPRKTLASEIEDNRLRGIYPIFFFVHRYAGIPYSSQMAMYL